MLDEKTALEIIAHKERPVAFLVDARSKPDGTVEVFLDDEKEPSYKVEVVVTRLKGSVVDGAELDTKRAV
jgi:hypothetical protein